MKQIVPASAVCEEALLGCAIDGAFNDVVVDGVDGSWFNELLHKNVWSHMEKLSANGKEVNLLNLMNATKADPEFKEYGGSPVTLSHMVDQGPFAANWIAHVDELRGQLKRRQYQQFGGDVVRLAKEFENVDEFADEVESRVMQLRKFKEAKTTESRKESLAEIMAMMDEIHRGTGLNGLPSGWKDLDDMLCGLRKGQLITVAARPAIGKSTFCSDIGRYLSCEKGIPVGIFSLEMTQKEILRRMCAAESDVNLQDFDRHIYDENERLAAMTRMANAMPKLNEAPLHVTDRSDITINKLRAEARRMVRNQGVQFIIIDMLQLVKPSSRGNRVVEVGEVSRNLKAMAMELDIPVLAVAACNRALETDGDREPRLADIRESGSIESDSDVVLMLHVEDYNISDRDRLFMQCYVAKNRSGRMGKFNIVFCRTYNRFEDERCHPDLSHQYETKDEEESKPRGKRGRAGWVGVNI